MRQTDKIYIHDLIVSGRHGVTEHERLKPQKFRVNIEISYNMQQAQQTDNEEDVVNWSEVKAKVIDYIEHTSYHLMETLIDKLATAIMEDQRINKLYLSIDKIEAFRTGYPGIVITRTR